LVAGPLSVVGVGFLYASDAPSVVLKATLVHTIVIFVIAFPLLPVVGPAAIGIGSLTGAVVDAMIMSRAIQRRSSSRPLEGLLPTLAVAAVAAASGLAVSAVGPPGLVTGIEAGASAAAVYLAIMAVVRRAVMVDTFGLIADAVRSALSREPKLTPVAGDPA
jgi:peptidoglycan biosynthesis protein MviN/MurJ (putative lipid II flippase)